MSKIIVYTINNCPFCEQEKVYLNEHKLLFEEKNIDTNRAYLSEMLAVSDNFTGVPFTLIQKDDGSKITLKGFTKEEFDTALGISVVSPQVESSIHIPSTQQSPTPPVVPPPIQAQEVNSSPDGVHDQKLQDILSNLQKISGMSGQSEDVSSVSSTKEPVASVVPPPIPQATVTESSALPSAMPASPFHQPPAPHVENTEPVAPPPLAKPQPTTVPESVVPVVSPPVSSPLPNIPSLPSIPDFPK